MPDWKSPLRADPSEWLVLNASAPIKLRLLTELQSLTLDNPEIAKLKDECLKWPTAKSETRYQRQDGTWGGMITSKDPKKTDRTTEKVLWCLFELTWGREEKEIKKAAKPLRDLLKPHKKDLPLYEFKDSAKQDPIRERQALWLLRIVALGLLMRAGFTDDKKLVDMLEDLVLKVMDFVANPVSRNPVERVGVGLPHFKRESMREGYCFIPDIHLLKTFAQYPPLLESVRARSMIKKIFDYVMSPNYQDLGPELGSIRTARGAQERGGGIIFRPIEEYLEQGNLDELLFLLEQCARLGLINRYPQLMGYVEWFLAHQEKDGRWDLPAKYFGAKPLYTAWTRLEKDWKSPNRRVADVTFRLMLILKLQWERQIKMLERLADIYGY